MEITMEDGTVIMLMTDEASMEIVSKPSLVDAFNQKLDCQFRMIGYMKFKSVSLILTSANIGSSNIPFGWMKYSRYETRFFNYITEIYDNSSRFNSLVTYIRKTISTHREFFTTDKKGDYTVVLILKL